MTTDNYHIGWCPYCDQGWIDVVKDTLNDNLLLLCDECDTIWNQPEDIKIGSPVKNLGKLEVPSFAEIKQKGWDKWFDVE